MNVTVGITGRVVLAAGVLVLNSDQNSFYLQAEDLRIDYTFVKGVPGPARVDTKNTGPKSAELTMYGFDNPLGVSYDTPNVMTINGVTYTFTFYVHANDKEPIVRLISYTFSRGV